jgi:hypothetical protein
MASKPKFGLGSFIWDSQNIIGWQIDLNVIPPTSCIFPQTDMLEIFTPNVVVYSCPPETLVNVIFYPWST